MHQILEKQMPYIKGGWSVLAYYLWGVLESTRETSEHALTSLSTTLTVPFESLRACSKGLFANSRVAKSQPERMKFA